MEFGREEIVSGVEACRGFAVSHFCSSMGYGPREPNEQVLAAVAWFELISRYFLKDKIVLGSDYLFPLGEERAGELIESIDEYSVELKVIFLFNRIFFVFSFFCFFHRRGCCIEMRCDGVSWSQLSF